MALGLKSSKADFFWEKKYIEIEITLYLPHGNRKVKDFLDCGTENKIISQYFVKQNGLQETFIKRIKIAVDGYRITIYKSHNLLIKAKDYHNVT